MKVKNRLAGLLAAIMALGVLALPITASAQTLRQQSQQRQKHKNNWRNLAIGAGAVALYGLLKKDKMLTLGGAAGAGYSLYRYEQDRKSQADIDTRRSRNYYGRRR
jgi:hypothetical protein